jgi:hypothetical protein
MISCNYNGWADVPEEEREGIDAFEATLALPVTVLLARMLPPPRTTPQRKAA